MTNPEVAILMLCLFIVLVLLGFPIAFTLLAMGVAFGYYAYYQGGIETFADLLNYTPIIPNFTRFLLQACNLEQLNSSCTD